MGVQPAGVGDLAAGNDQAHGGATYRPLRTWLFDTWVAADAPKLRFGDELATTGEFADARPDGTRYNDRQGEVLQGARPRREPERDARLLVRGAAPSAPEREARHRRRGHRQEAARAAVHVDAAAGREARRAGSRCAGGQPRGPGARGARPQ